MSGEGRIWRISMVKTEEIQEHRECDLELLSKNEVLFISCDEVIEGVSTFPCFRPAFCEKLLEEIEHIEVEAQRLFIELHRPNSMNRYGMVLNEVGFQDLLNALTKKLVEPLS